MDNLKFSPTEILETPLPKDMISINRRWATPSRQLAQTSGFSCWPFQRTYMDLVLSLFYLFLRLSPNTWRVSPTTHRLAD